MRRPRPPPALSWEQFADCSLMDGRLLRPLAAVPQPEMMLTTTRGRATVAGLDPGQEYALRILLLNGTAEKLLAKRHFTSK